MKKFTKLFLSCALVSVVAAASASIAMAADGDVKLTDDLKNSVYNPTSNTITIAAADVPEIVEGSQATYLVVEGTDKVENKIEGIDQATKAAFDKTGLKSNPTADDETEYTVYVGYYKGTAEENTFTIVKGKLYAQAAAYIVGDADENNRITIGDAQVIAAWLVKSTAEKEANPLPAAADADLNNRNTIGDAQAVAGYLVLSEANKALSPIGKAPGAVASN